MPDICRLAQKAVRFGDPYTRIDPFFRNRLNLVRGENPPQTLPDDFMAPAGAWSMPQGVKVEESFVAGPAEDIPICIYRSVDNPAPGWLVWMHGGGFVEGSMDSPEAHAFCAEMVSRIGMGCVSVGYRLASDCGGRYPAALEDVETVWRWLVEGLNGDYSEIPMMIGGASAGANLAASLCLKLRDANDAYLPDAMLSAYGVFHGATIPVSTGWKANTAILPVPLRFTASVCRGMYRAYVGREDQLPCYSVPGEATDFTGFPPTAMVYCEFDDLAPSSLVFAEQLRESNVTVTTHMAQGMLHGFLNWYPVKELPQTLDTLDFFDDFVRKVITRKECESIGRRLM